MMSFFLPKFLAGILGETTTSWIHSEFNWPLECMFMIAVVQLRLVRIGTCSWPMRKIFRRVQKHSIRVMGCRVCQLNLCHNNVLIGDLKSLRIKLLRKAENSKKKEKIRELLFAFLRNRKNWNYAKPLLVIWKLILILK